MLIDFRQISLLFIVLFFYACEQGMDENKSHVQTNIEDVVFESSELILPMEIDRCILNVMFEFLVAIN